MGFFDGFAKGIGDKEVIKMVNDEDDELLSNNYRKTGLQYAESKNGWYKCVRCGKSFRKGDIEVDHIIPQSKGGTNSRYNLQCMCKRCNTSKGNKTSDTSSDLRRRKKELIKQEKEDLEYLNSFRRK